MWTPTQCSHYSETFRPTFLWEAAGGAPPRRLHLRLQGNLRQVSEREEREVGVREEEDNKSQLCLKRGGPEAVMMIIDSLKLKSGIFTLSHLREALSEAINCFVPDQKQ